MNKAITIVDNLRAKGILFSDPPTKDELYRIEKTYCFQFPESLRCFYSFGIPYEKEDNRFPLWTDFSETNVNTIKKRIHQPYEWVLKSVLRDFWLPQWGERPEDRKSVVKCFTDISKNAPKLIPIFSHRYMPQLKNVDNPPVISTVGRDTVYYGSDIWDYLQNEFELSCRALTSDDRIFIPFWSDIIDSASFNQVFTSLEKS